MASAQKASHFLAGVLDVLGFAAAALEAACLGGVFMDFLIEDACASVLLDFDTAALSEVFCPFAPFETDVLAWLP